MRIKSVVGIRGGEILAEPVLTEKNDILIPKGTALKEDYVPLIQSLGIDSLMLEDPFEEYEEPNHFISINSMNRIVTRVTKLMEGHIYHSNKSLREFEVIANDIVKEICDMPEDIVIDVQEHNSNLYEHTVIVTLLAVMIAKNLKLERTKLYNIAIGCLLHDIGIRYITVPYQNRDINDDDQASIFEYKKHTILGYSALDEENWVPEIAKKMILSHHENLNGTGFPMKQKNREIECRIIQACDAFDCFISGMECKRISVQDALLKMEELSDKLFDGKIVENLISVVARYPVGTTVKTNEETKGVVVSQTIDPTKPVIMVLDDNMEIENTSLISKLNLMLENMSILQVV